jgi:hypothetical protein
VNYKRENSFPFSILDKKKCPKMKTKNTFGKKLAKKPSVTKMLTLPK